MLETLLHNNNLSQPLLLTDLPKMVRIFEIQYELQYSESYVGNLLGNCFPTEVFAYCVTVSEAFNSLLGNDPIWIA